jgi:hypothetical protein
LDDFEGLAEIGNQVILVFQAFADPEKLTALVIVVYPDEALRMTKAEGVGE